MANKLPKVYSLICRDLKMIKSPKDKEGLLPMQWCVGKDEWYNLRASLVCGHPAKDIITRRSRFQGLICLE